jgi:hypothetical protein
VLRFVASALCVAVAFCIASAARADSFGQNSVLFVHGIEGSGAQFESQKMRFMSNGYPEAWVDEVDYDSTRAVGDKSAVDAQIDAAIAHLKQVTGKPKVDVIAHSLGTSVMYDYLTNGAMAASRKANIGRYVNVDGQNQNPGVPTLAVWAGKGAPGRHMDGAANVVIPDSTHVQTATSAASFVEYYKFLTGSPPAHDIVPQTGQIQIAGKALNFPQNTGLTDATIQVWQVNESGRRTTTAPAYALSGLDATGQWGPLAVNAGTRYEFAIVRTGHPTLHVYYEPFVRSDYAIRLLDSDALTTYAGARPGSESAVMIRYKELWGDQGGESDQLLVNGLNLCTPNLCPISHQVNALFAFDENRDGKTDLSQPDPVLNQLPFITGADVFIPGSSPGGTPSGTTSFQLLSRGAAPIRTLDVPNWDSTTDGVIVQWDDFEQPVPASASAGAPSTAATTPSATCVRRQRFTYRIHQPSRGRIVRVSAFIDGRRVKRVRGRRITRLELPRPAGKTSFTVRIVALSNRGQRTVSVRRYRRCDKTRPQTRVHGHRH